MDIEKILKEAGQAANKAAEDKLNEMLKAGPRFTVHQSNLDDS